MAWSLADNFSGTRYGMKPRVVQPVEADLLVGVVHQGVMARLAPGNAWLATNQTKNIKNSQKI
jgi:hypothetical protein